MTKQCEIVFKTTVEDEHNADKHYTVLKELPKGVFVLICVCDTQNYKSTIGNTQ